jgi:hypothetical protein
MGYWLNASLNYALFGSARELGVKSKIAESVNAISSILTFISSMACAFIVLRSHPDHLVSSAFEFFRRDAQSAYCARDFHIEQEQLSYVFVQLSMLRLAASDNCHRTPKT